MKRKWWIAGVAGAVVVALVGAGVVMAQTPTPGASGSSPSFLDRVAQKLGIETPKLQDGDQEREQRPDRRRSREPARSRRRRRTS